MVIKIALRFSVGRLVGIEDTLSWQASPNGLMPVIIIIIVVIGEMDLGHSCLRFPPL
jgi:hypothetical protein